MKFFPRWAKVMFAACAASFGGTLILFLVVLFAVGSDKAELVWSGWPQLTLWLLVLPVAAKYLKDE